MRPKYRENYSTIFSAVTRIRPIIIITFGTTNVVVHNHSTIFSNVPLDKCPDGENHSVRFMPGQAIVL